MSDTKTCSKCGCTKLLSEFPVCYGNHHKYYRGNCKQCQNEYMIKWGKNNPDKIKENQHKWSKKHPEYFIKWCAEHIEQRQEYARKWNENHREQQWYANHPEQRKESSRRYRQTLKGKINDANNRHRRRVRKKGGKITLDEWTTIKQQQGFRCYWCKQKFEDKELTMDHVIPLSKGGLHDEGNIVAACRSCNLSKHAQIWSLV